MMLIPARQTGLAVHDEDKEHWYGLTNLSMSTVIPEKGEMSESAE